MDWGLGKVLDLRAGERVPVSQAAGVLALVIGAHTLLETARDALFLEKLPAHRLSLVYAAMALLSLLAVRITERFVFRFGRRNAFIFTLMAAAYLATTLYLAPENTAVIFVLYIFTGVVGTLLTLQFWLLAGSLFTVAQGKRLFGPLAAGGVLGAVAAASSAMLLLSMLPVKALVLVAAGLFLVAAGVLSTVTLTDVQRKPGRVERERGGLRLEAFRGHPYVRRVAAFIVSITAAVLLADYLFKWSAAQLIPKTQLGGFFASYYAALNAASFIVQVFLSGYLVRRLGVVSAILILPLLLTVGGAGALLLGGSFLMVLLTRGVDGSLRHSLHRVSTELLWMPLGPEVREGAKSVVDSVFVRLTQASSAGFILLVSTFGPEDPKLYAGLVTLFAVLAVVVGVSLRRPYLDLFRTALGSRSPRRMDLQLDLRSVEIVVEALSSRDSARVLAAIDLLAAKQRQRLIPSLILYHDAEEVLLRALEVIAVPERRDWVPLTERLLTHASEVVRAAAVRALARADHWSELVEARLSDISPGVRAHATYWRTQRLHPDEDPRDQPAVAEILAIEGEPGMRARLALLDAIADGADPRWTSVVLERAEKGGARELEGAARAIKRLPDPRFIPLLIPRLAVRAGRAAIRSAIEAHGEPAQAMLEAAFIDEETDPRVRLHIPRSLAWFGNQRAADFLSSRIDIEKDRRVAYKLLRALERLAELKDVSIDTDLMEAQLRRNLVRYFEVLALKNAMTAAQGSLDERSSKSGALLIDLLDDKLRQALERSFSVLKTLHRREDFRSVLVAFRSESARVRAQAAELIDGLLQSARTEAGTVSRELFRILADDLADAERVRRARPHLGTLPESVEDALISLMSDPREPQAALTVHHVLNLDAPRLRDDARRIANERPGLLRAVIDEHDRMSGAMEPANVG